MQDQVIIGKQMNIDYETTTLFNRYMLFHYGSSADLLPFSFGPKDSIHFPIRCVTDCLNLDRLSKDSSALELGCAVGRSSFELAKHCKKVTAIDASHHFIDAAKQIQEFGELEYQILLEGNQPAKRIARLPEGIDPNRIEFICCDVMECLSTLHCYDVVLAVNLICRLPDPEFFLKQMAKLVSPGGQCIIVSPYSWLKEFTPKEKWLGRGASNSNTPPLESIKEIMTPDFDLHTQFDMPFLLREHYRKYEWGVSQASIWIRK